MASPQNENETSLPSEYAQPWKRAIWVNLIELILFCTIPVIICPPEGYPFGTLFNSWAIYGLFYMFEDRAPGMTGSTPGSEIRIILFVITIVFFTLNVSTYYIIITKKNPRHFSLLSIRRCLKIALYGPVVFWLFSSTWFTLETFIFPIGVGWEYIVIPIYLVVLFPWFLRFHYSKQAIEGMGEKSIDEAWAAPVRKAILELGTKYTRLQVNEIAEKVNIKNEKQIVAVVQDMIKREQIAAEYFKSSRTVAFDQQANTQVLAKFITDLEGEFTAWGKEGKKT